MWAALRSVVAELFRPSGEDETSYQGMVIGISHAMVGAALITLLPWNLEWPGVLSLWGLRIGVALFYALSKEYGDWRFRGGSLIDGLKDTGWVWLGCYYDGPLWWPLTILLLAGVSAIREQMIKGDRPDD